MTDDLQPDQPGAASAAPREPDTDGHIPVIGDLHQYSPGSDAARCPDINALEPRPSADENLQPIVVLWAVFDDASERPIGTLTPDQARALGTEYLTAAAQAERDVATIRYLTDTMPIGLREAVEAVCDIAALQGTVPGRRYRWRTNLLADRVKAFRSPGGFTDTPVRCLKCYTVVTVYAEVRSGTGMSRVELAACVGCAAPRHWVCGECGRPDPGWQGGGWGEPCEACANGERLAPADAPQGQA